ncbi:hypothetical protein DAI22_11g042200 [Oryza sativa Japonica Group]|nr:hypothetical protein DAI22_11g042200 [Oryza sativa Japonica Group]
MDKLGNQFISGLLMQKQFLPVKCKNACCITNRWRPWPATLRPRPKPGPATGSPAQPRPCRAERRQREARRRDDHHHPHPVGAGDEPRREQRERGAGGEGQRRGGRGLAGARHRRRRRVQSQASRSRAAAAAPAFEVGELDVELHVDGDVLADGHAAGAGDEAGQPGQEDGARVGGARRADAEHERRGGDEAVAGAQHRGAQPLGAHSAAAVVGGFLLLLCLLRHGELGIAVGGSHARARRGAKSRSAWRTRGLHISGS